MHAQHYRLADYREVPWKNGLGSTRELTDSGSNDGFVWRLSIPEIAEAGPFSRFEGVDRLLMLMEGRGLELRCGQRDATILNARFDAIHFRGDDATESRLHDGPVRVFNIMAARDKVRFSASVLHLGSEPVRHYPAAFGTTLIHCVEGHCRVADHELAEQETLRIDTSSGGHRLLMWAAMNSATIIKIDIVDR